MKYLESGFDLCNYYIGNKVVRVGEKSFDIISSIFIEKTNISVRIAMFYLISFNHEESKAIKVLEVIRNICSIIDE